MALYKIHQGKKMATMVIEDLKEEVTPNPATQIEPKMWALIKYVGDNFPLHFSEKFRLLRDLECKLYEYRPTAQLRYFARIKNSGFVIYHKEQKKKRSLKTKEYNEICKKFDYLIRSADVC